MIVEISHVYKQFGAHVVLNDLSLKVEEHSFTILYGASGCGKSTLLNLIGLLDTPDQGDIVLFGEKNVKPFSKKAESLLRNKIGYLFQNYALEDEETVEANMDVAFINQKLKKEEKKAKIQEALHEVGLDGYEKKKIYECSGGEQQRISLARLLIKPCELILADEPTGNLDKANKKIIFELLKNLQKKGKTLIVVTHDEDLIELGDAKIKL